MSSTTALYNVADAHTRLQLAIHNRGQQKVFTFDRVYDGAATQEAVYEDTKPLIRSVLDGKSSGAVQCLLLPIPLYSVH